MAGFEVVVRPVVFPNIRPAAPRALQPADDPEKGFAVIRGNGASFGSVSNSYNLSASSAKQTETQRRVDVARVYQKTPDGAINKTNFIDTEVPNKIWMKGPPGRMSGGIGASGLPTGGGGGMGIQRSINFYSPVKSADNVEILKTGKIVQSGED